jgi:hypothetical protein
MVEEIEGASLEWRGVGDLDEGCALALEGTGNATAGGEVFEEGLEALDGKPVGGVS